MERRQRRSTPSRRRHAGRPRWGRICALGCSLLITVLAAVTAAGLLPLGTEEATAVAVEPDPRPPRAAGTTVRGAAAGLALLGQAVEPADSDPPAGPPARSGHGRRVVFDMSEQRVWLINRNGRVQATYLVSGSKTDNLEPGRYEVYSRSRRATSFDLDSTMRFMVRFAHGERAAIGFHDIPVNRDGELVQRPSELGSPRSHGCIRQHRPDARRMWRFADLGTTVVVTA